jgi:tetratricopeptide (TPR) repeat protein
MNPYDHFHALIQQNKLSEASAALLRQVQVYPRDAQAWTLLSTLMHRMSKPATADLCLRRAVLLSPLENGQLRPLPSARETISADQHDAEVETCLLVPKKTVGAAMIVKNASRTIERVLTALLPAVDQLVVVDTGSTDDTVAIVQALGIPVHHEPWQDDFAAARNLALSKMETDWVLSIDSDEELYPEDVDNVRTIAGLLDDLPGAFALRIFQMNQIGDVISPSLETRLFPHHRGIQWFRPIHEQLVAENAPILPSYPVLIRVRHDGYDARKTDVEQKYRRNVALLSQHVQTYPTDDVSHAFLGREYLMLGEIENALHHLQLAKELLSKNPHTPSNALMDVVRNIVLAYDQLGEGDRALQVARQMSVTYPQSVDASYLCGYLYLKQATNALQQATPYLEQALKLAGLGHHSADPTIGSFKARLHLADILRLSGNWVESKAEYESILAQIPGFSEVESILLRMKQQSKILEDY